MQFNQYTLLLLALFIFAGSFGVGLISSDTTENRLANRNIGFRVAPFGVQTAQIYGVFGDAFGDPVSYWSFDEGAGVTLLDQSKNTNIGIINGDPSWVSGKVGKALYFDGLKDYITIFDNSLLDLSDEFTIFAWVKPVFNSGGIVLSKNGFDSDTRGGYEFSLFGDTLSYGVRGLSAVPVSQARLNGDEWVHIALSYNVEKYPTTHLYLNGNKLFSSALGAPVLNTNALLIGRNNLGKFFKGSIDEVRIYNKTFADGDVRELYSAYLESGDVAGGNSNSLTSLLSRFVDDIKATALWFK